MPEVSPEELRRIDEALARSVENEKRNARFMNALGSVTAKMLQPALDRMADELRSIGGEIAESLKNLELRPEVHVPEFPPPHVTVDIPEIRLPSINVPKTEVKFPKSDAVERKLEEIKTVLSEQRPAGAYPDAIPWSNEKPLPVILTDPKGEPYIAQGGGGRGPSVVGLKNESGLQADFGSGSERTALRVVHASDFAQSVSVSGFTSTVSVQQIDPDGNYRGTFPVDTELPAAAALADATANPTVPGIGAYLMTWTGVDWSRALQIIGDSDNQNATDRGLLMNARLFASDGTSWDRLRNNVGTADTALRVVEATDSVVSTSVKSVDVSLETRQVSGFTDSVNVVGFTSSVNVVGSVASDVADDGEPPVKIGGIARTANPTAVSGGDRVVFAGDKLGRQLITPIQVRDLRATAFATLSTNTETTLLAGAASTLHDLVWIKFANTSSGAVTVDLRDGTGGTIVDTWEVPANGVSGAALGFPWPQSEAAASWTVDYNDADVSNTTVYVSAGFTKEV